MTSRHGDKAVAVHCKSDPEEDMQTEMEHHHHHAVPSKEITRDEAICSLLTDEDLSDITLQGNDGVTVHANRCILAARSKVFRGMLFGNFSEASASVVSLGYPGSILKSIVEYIYTNEPAFLSMEDALMEASLARQLTSSAAAALYFDLPVLHEKIMRFASDTLRQNPQFSALFLEECLKMESAMQSSEILDMALSNIRSNPASLLSDTEKLSKLSMTTLEMVLSDDQLEAEEITAFRIVQEWARVVAPSEDAETTRKEQARSLMKHINFDRIDPKDLSTTVSSSGLVSTEILFEAFKHQALAAVNEHKIEYASFRHHRQLKWKSSGNRTFNKTGFNWTTDVLDFPPMKAGSYEWTIDILEMTKHLRIGLLPAPSAEQDPEHFSDLIIGKAHGSWAFSSTGRVYASPGHKQGRKVRAEFKAGDQVRMTLDLSDTGVLKATINGSVNEIVLFENMKHGHEMVAVANGVRESEEASSGNCTTSLAVVPAVSFFCGGKVRIVNLKRIY